jgi:SAM-dependent methyltransferase
VRQYAKLCDRRDFDDPALIAAITSLVPERDPLHHIERKVWEFAIVMLFMDEAGLLDDRTEALSVGAGNERILFWLANRIGRIVATDIYGEGRFADGEAGASMLTDPASHAPYPYRSDHLEVLAMDGRELEFDDASFDFVFTVSSIEHFGGAGDIARAASEIGRVLRPGGHAVIVTDCLAKLHPLDATPVGFALKAMTGGRFSAAARPRRRGALTEMFTPAELQTGIVEPSGLVLTQPLDTTLSAETFDNVTRVRPDGTLVPATGERYPLIVLQVGHSLFTSVCLPLAKPVR